MFYIMNILQENKSYFTAKDQPEVVEIGKATYLSILGKGSPGTAIFYKKKSAIKEFVAALSSVFHQTENNFESNIVEIFYWFNEEKVGYVDIGNFYTTVDLNLLQYRIVIRIPDFNTDETIKKVAQENQDLPFHDEFELFTYTAGKCVQILHTGPFADELETLPVLQQFATENNFKKSGMHHEIHLTNFEIGQSQENLQTILRDPVQKEM